MRERVAGYIGVGSPSKVGLTNGEWVTIGEESGQWQAGGSIVEEGEGYCVGVRWHRISRF
jgi:hypothetical protein